MEEIDVNDLRIKGRPYLIADDLKDVEVKEAKGQKHYVIADTFALGAAGFKTLEDFFKAAPDYKLSLGVLAVTNASLQLYNNVAKSLEEDMGDVHETTLRLGAFKAKEGSIDVWSVIQRLGMTRLAAVEKFNKNTACEIVTQTWLLFDAIILGDCGIEYFNHTNFYVRFVWWSLYLKDLENEKKYELLKMVDPKTEWEDEAHALMSKFAESHEEHDDEFFKN